MDNQNIYALDRLDAMRSSCSGNEGALHVRPSGRGRPNPAPPCTRQAQASSFPTRGTPAAPSCWRPPAFPLWRRPAPASLSSLGKQDFAFSDERLGVSLDEMLGRCAEIATAVAVPVSADLEAGYGDEPEAVAATVGRAVEAGLAGGNIEDKVTGSRGGLR
jgi:hypothetical protein